MQTFKIKDLNWKLSYFDPDLEEDGLDSGVCGRTDYVDNMIHINMKMDKAQKRRTLKHELTHAFRWSYGFVSNFEVVNTPSSELEEVVANTVEVFGEDIIELTNKLLKKGE